MNNGKKKALFLLPPENYREEEYWIPKEILEGAYVETSVASSTRLPIRGHRERFVQPDLLFSEVEPDFFHAFIFVGGEGTKALWENPLCLRLAQKAYSQGKLVCGICYGALIPLLAQVLPYAKATTFFDAQPLLKSLGVQVIPYGVVRDDRLITASSPEYAEEFGREVLKALVGETT